MVWMMLIMVLPLLGLGLFFVLPLATALALYIIVFAVSGTFHYLMMRALRLPAQMGPERMIGSSASVRSWQGRRGQVVWDSEVWEAETPGGSPLATGERVVIDGRSGLTLEVRSASESQAPEHARNAVGDKCSLDGLPAFQHLVGRGFRLGGFEKFFTWPHRAEKLAR